ncbi:MAG: archaemetzincin [Mariniblastus sp.]|jgi:archaemetzincin
MNRRTSILASFFGRPGFWLVVFMLAMACLGETEASAQVDRRSPQRPLNGPAIKKTINQLKPIHSKLGKPEAGDWLSSHNEKGQTYAQYVRIQPNTLTRERNRLYVQPIGKFSAQQTKLIELSAEYLAIYYNCSVKILETQDESGIPESAQRTHPTWGDHQLLTSHILEKILAPELPSDAFATIAFTSSDLWPGDGWNFVFGYASFRDRVGVWSLHRFGDPEAGPAEFKKCLLRTLKVATHETGHMFSIQHCIKFACNMQGSNSLPESDQQPLALCPECHAKILFATGAEPVARFKKLIVFCETHKLAAESEYFKKALNRLDKK